MNCLQYCNDSNSQFQSLGFRRQKRKRNSTQRTQICSNVSKSEAESSHRRRDNIHNLYCNHKFSQNHVTYHPKTCLYPSHMNVLSNFSTPHQHVHPSFMFSSVPPIEHRPSYQEDLAKRGFLVKYSLGAGSYSKVKKALYTHANLTEVAVKIIDRCYATKDYLEKFLPREVNIWMRLNHSNLVQLIDYFEENMRVYMVLEYASGGDALNYIQQHGPLREKIAREWFIQIACALSYMHKRNIAHRDLKLENLLLFEGGSKIKLGDFGFVKDIHSLNELSNTFCGSKAYAAPEILSGQSYDPKKGDVWALGVVLYIILTGKMPFNETRGIKSILEEQASLNLLDLTTGSHRVIMKAFTWNVAMRPDIDSLRKDPWVIS